MSTFPGVAFITGAGSSLGAAIASSLISHGCSKLALVDGSSKRLSQTITRLQSNTSQKVDLEQILCDVTSDSAIEDAIAQAVTKFGVINYCINIPSLLSQVGASLDITPEKWNEVLRVNQRATWLNLRGELRQLLSQQENQTGDGKVRSSIVTVTTSHGLGAQPGFPATAASAHAIVGMTRTTAMDYASSGVCVNAVCAGPMATEDADGESEKRLLGVVPIGRVITVEEVSSAVLWLLGDGAAAVTGLAVPVDGAWTLCHY